MRTINRAIVVLLMAALCAALFAPAALAVDPYAPIITSQTTGPIILKPGQSITLQVEAESPEGLPLSYQWREINNAHRGSAFGAMQSAQLQGVPFSKNMGVRPFKGVEDQLFYCEVSLRRIDPVTGETTVHKTQSEVIRVQCHYNFWYIMGAYFRYILGFLEPFFILPFFLIGLLFS